MCLSFPAFSPETELTHFVLHPLEKSGAEKLHRKKKKKRNHGRPESIEANT
jgi:hypothetical protein